MKYDEHREHISREFEKKHSTMRVTSNELHVQLSTWRRLGWHVHAELWNIALFINLAALDLSVLIYQSASERDPWTRKMIARQLALSIYESADDLIQLLGKPLREPLERLGILNQVDPDLRKAKEPLHEFWAAESSILKKVRVSSIAHLEHDAVVLFDAIEGIVAKEMLGRGLRYGRIQYEIGQTLQRILVEAASVRPPEIDSPRA